MSKIIVATAETIANYQVTETFGEVFGQTTRSRNIISSFGQNLKSVVGGEIKGYTQLQEESRQEALDRLREAAEKIGANAVICCRFDSNSNTIGDSVTSYGTAVTIEPRN